VDLGTCPKEQVKKNGRKMRGYREEAAEFFVVAAKRKSAQNCLT
jgi:hypothetical protein